MRPPRFRLRIATYDDPELYCHGCQDFYPVTLEFWHSKTDFSRCRGCENERKRLHQAKRLLDPEGRIKNIEKSRRYREYLKANNLLSAQAAVMRERQNARARDARAA